jgi:anti-sigma factor (TIGR02949 family)
LVNFSTNDTNYQLYTLHSSSRKAMATPVKNLSNILVNKEMITKQTCTNHAECMKAIQLILDGEASKEQLEHFNQNIDKCMPCVQKYNLEQSIREALRCKLEKKCPKDLIDSIKSKINEAV